MKIKNLILALLCPILLTACTELTETIQPNPVQKTLVYSGQYIVDINDRSFLAWSNLVDEVYKSEHIKVIQQPTVANAGEIVEYDPANDLCLTEAMKDVVCEPNYVASINIDTNDDRRDDLWGIDNIDAPDAWEETRETGIKIAVLDTGIYAKHEDLRDSVTMQYNAYDQSNEARDGHGHGTHVSGTICATGNNEAGIVGVAWKCNLMAVKVLANNGGGSYSAIIDGIDWAVRNGAKVINASFGGGAESALLKAAIIRAKEAGVVFVAAAGNSGTNNDTAPHWPSIYDVDNVISVAAIDEEENLANFSNYGEASVDLAAPGVTILSSFPDGSYRAWSGTSMATPHVSGAAALILHRQPELNPRQVRNKLLGGGKKLSTLQGRVGSGATLNLPGAFEAFQGSPTDPGEPTPQPPTNPCKKRKLKQCKSNCDSNHACNCKKQKNCKKRCQKLFCPNTLVKAEL